MTKFSHSCVRVVDEGRVLVIDPGVFSDAGGALTGVDAVLITHEHPDHVDIAALNAALVADPELNVWGPVSIGGVLTEFPDRFVPLEAGQSVSIAGFDIETFGGQHAVIHPSIPCIANLGYLVEGSLYHPGDSFAVPNRPVDTLLVPIHAPWSKVAEVIDFVVSVRAPQAFQIHDSLLTPNGLGIVEGHVMRIGAQYGCDYSHLKTGETLNI